MHYVVEKASNNTSSLNNSKHNIDTIKIDIKYQGSSFFRLRVVLATIFSKTIQISKIRENSVNPGLNDYEANFIRLLSKITDGSFFHINSTGSIFTYKPGSITGGDKIIHDCGHERNISYFIEALIMLSPFSKNGIHINLFGITHGSGNGNSFRDPSVDYLRCVLIPMVSRICCVDNLQVKIKKRGFSKDVKGEVELFSPMLKKIEPFKFLEEGRVKRIRGVAFHHNMSSNILNQCIDKVRNVLNEYIPDIWIYSSRSNSNENDKKHCYGVTLVAETMKGFYKGADIVVYPNSNNENMINPISNTVKGKEKSIPIENIIQNNNVSTKLIPITENFLDTNHLVGVSLTNRLLLEISLGGITDTTYQYFPLLFMAFSEEYQISEVKLQSLTPYTIEFIRHLKQFSNIVFIFENTRENISFNTLGNDDEVSDDDELDSNSTSSSFNQKEDEENIVMVKKLRNDFWQVSQIIVKCVGIGLVNINRKTF